jgi:hypothetical protein
VERLTTARLIIKENPWKDSNDQHHRESASASIALPAPLRRILAKIIALPLNVRLFFSRRFKNFLVTDTLC